MFSYTIQGRANNTLDHRPHLSQICATTYDSDLKRAKISLKNYGKLITNTISEDDLTIFEGIIPKKSLAFFIICFFVNKTSVISRL